MKTTNIGVPAPAADTVLDSILHSKPEIADNIILEWIRTEFQLPKSLINECEDFFLRVQEGKYVCEQVIDGVVERMDGRKKYVVHWKSTPALCAVSPLVGMSYRQYKGKCFVVIEIWKKKEGAAA